jgi:DNA-binding PadR family transcriptional regulator
MNFSPKPIQTLYIWRLLVSQGEAWLSAIKPQLKPLLRKELKQAGFITEEKRSTSKRSKGLYVQLTDQGWAWATDNLDAPLPSRSTAAVPVLQALLTKLKLVLKKHNIALVEILAPAEPIKPPSDGDLESRVREAYFQLSGGKANVRVRLAHLRQALPDVGRDTLDGLLLKLQRAEKLVLYSLDNPKEISPEDVEAAITLAGFSNHIVHMRK